MARTFSSKNRKRIQHWYWSRRMTAAQIAERLLADEADVQAHIDAWLQEEFGTGEPEPTPERDLPYAEVSEWWEANDWRVSVKHSIGSAFIVMPDEARRLAQELVEAADEADAMRDSTPS